MQEQNAPVATQTTAEEVKLQAKNFNELRTAAEQVKKENLELKQRLAQLEESVKKVPAKREDEDSNEPYVDHNKLRKEMDRFKESLVGEIDKKAEEKARSLIEEERKAHYLEKNKDFYEIMKEDELQKFISEYPSMAATLQKMPDTFERQQLVYESIKTLKGLKTNQPTPASPKSPLAQAFDARKAAMAYQPGGSSGGPFQSIGDYSQGGMKNAYERFKALQKTVSL